MHREVILLVNGRATSTPSDRLIPIREVDHLQLRVRADERTRPLYALFGDQRTDFEADTADPGWWQTRVRTYFSESCGHGATEIVYQNDSVSGNTVDRIDFDVYANKTTAAQARRMILYLASRHENLIASCFSRTTHRSGALPEGKAHPEMLLSAAERFLVLVQERRIELVHQMRERLVPQRVPLWQSRAGAHLDPADVLANLDALVPCTGEGDVVLRGRPYVLSNIHVLELQPTRDVVENRILLGGLYSIQRRIMTLLDELNVHEDGFTQGEMEGYESLGRLALTLTAGAMIRRANAIVRQSANLIRLFEKEFGITFAGELAPVMTAYARTSRVYRDMYSELVSWYALGAPALGSVHFLLKLRSLSKIFELYALFHTIEELQKLGWVGETMQAHSEFGEHVPQSITFTLGEDRLTMMYEPKILPPGRPLRHMELVDMRHTGTGDKSLWTPDYVLQLSRPGYVRYLILDAKYSKRDTVENYSLPSLYEKYYRDMAVYDADSQAFTSMPILGVFAIYALANGGRGHLEFWRGRGLFALVPRLPAIGGIGLTIDQDSEFREALVAALTIARRQIASSPALTFTQTSGPIIKIPAEA
jgi:hypothetical protein